MKTLLLSLIVLTSFCAAQVPNGSFETWTTTFGQQQPAEWQTLNPLFLFNNPLSAFKEENDVHSGNAALKISTIRIKNKPADLNAWLPDITGLAFTGNVSSDFKKLNYGFPNISRPDKLEFYYKYFPQGTDSAKVSVILLRRNGNKQDTVGYAQKILGPQLTAYFHSEVPIIYKLSGRPDTAVVLLLSSKDTLTGKVGSALLIDDIDLTGGDVGLFNYADEESISLFPNPVSDILTIKTTPGAARLLEISDLTGRTIARFPIYNECSQFNFESWDPGIYMYSILDMHSATIRSGKVCIVGK
jgi:hypothetical protein